MKTQGYRYISSDTHIYEPPDLWTGRMRGKFKDKAPWIDSRPEGDFYIVDGVDPVPCAGTDAANLEQKIAGREVEASLKRHSDARKEASDPNLRLNDQDLDNVRAEVLYPNVWEWTIFTAPDVEYAHACVQTYNDWLAEFCAVAPNRLIGVALLTCKGPIEWSIKEAKRVAQMGFKTVHIPVENVQHPYGVQDGYYDELWATLQDLGLVLSLHIGTITHDGGFMAFYKPGTTAGFMFACNKMQPQTIGNFISGGICQRFPDLKIVMVESGLAWIPMLLNNLDHFWKTGRKLMTPVLDEPPSFYFNRQMYATFEYSKQDTTAMQFLSPDRFLWGNDYPHVEGTFPASQKQIAESFTDFSEEVVRKVTEENAAKLYRI